METKDITQPLADTIKYVATLIFLLLVLAVPILLFLLFHGEPDWHDGINQRIHGKINETPSRD